jgi:hypothetical protein
LFIIGSLLLAGILSLEGQLQFPGKPIGKSELYKAGDVMYVLPPVDPLEIEAVQQSNYRSQKKPFIFAIDRPVDLSPESHGSWKAVDQYRVWRIHIVSPGAVSMGLVFNRYRLEEGVNVFVYDPGHQHIKGSFNSRNNKVSGVFPVSPIEGEELIIEMQVPAGMADYGDLGIESVSHAFLDPGKGLVLCAGRFGCSQACEIDVNCREGNDWQLNKRSVVRIYAPYEDDFGQGYQYCSGVLVNNTSYDGSPYLLTAKHCIDREDYANRAVFLFNYESPSCFGVDGSKEMEISEAELLSLGDSIDFSLVRLSVAPPASYDVFFAGWDLSDSQTAGTAAIHHPMGDVKKISFDHDIPSTPAKASDVSLVLKDYFYDSFWWVKQWDIGSTERGSSGSPLYNSEKRVIGMLHGGSAFCGDSIGYDAENDRVEYSKDVNRDDYYTKLNVAWDYYSDPGLSLKPWLDPGQTGVTAIGGYHPTRTNPPRMISGSFYSIYPNPVSEILRISTGHPSAGNVEFKVFDISGSLRISGDLDGTTTGEIPVGSLAPGVYLISIGSGGTWEFQRFIVAR